MRYILIAALLLITTSTASYAQSLEAQEDAHDHSKDMICAEIRADTGWQRMDIPEGIVNDIHVHGMWMSGSDMGGVSGMISGSGQPHLSGITFGSLLVAPEAVIEDDTTQAYPFMTVFKGFLKKGEAMSRAETVAMRINEQDAGLADNAGSLEICFGFVF